MMYANSCRILQPLHPGHTTDEDFGKLMEVVLSF